MSLETSLLAESISDIDDDQVHTRDYENFLPFDSNTYSQVYKSLCSLRTELEGISESIKGVGSGLSREDNQKIDYLHFLAESFLGYNFGVIFHCAENSKNDLKALLVSKNPIHPTVLELIISLLLFTLKVCRLMSYLKAHILAPNSSQEPLKCSLSSDSLSSNNIQSIPENSILVLCRICEEYVPLDLLEQHSNSCAIMFHEQSNILTTDERIGKLQKSIISKALSHPWPGEASFATNASLPILHVGFILESVSKVDSLDALSVYCEALSMISISPDISPHSEFLSRARTLVTDKKEAHIRYSEANSARGYTLTEPTSKSTNDVKISDFELVERISSGAYARVYYAIKKNTRDRYAIKAVSKSTLQNKNQINMLLTEKDLLLSFSNPYVVKFYFSFTGFHNYYIVMELLPGGDLYSILDKLFSLPEEPVRFYTAEIVMALKYLREKGIIHRDLKPDNILVSENGHIKLADFGLSKAGFLDREILSKETTTISKFYGTPHYVSPETIMDHADSYSIDYWSLGVIVYEMIFSTTPFTGSTGQEVFANIITGKFEFPPEAKNFSPELLDFISKLLVSDPEKRMGHKNIQEIMDHPWFKGVDWENLINLPPPFSPDDKFKSLKDYFSEKEFTAQAKKGDADIYEDIRIAEQTESIEEEFPKAENFHSTSIDNLKGMNQKIIRTTRSNSFLEPISNELQVNCESNELYRSVSMKEPPKDEPDDILDTLYTPPKQKIIRPIPSLKKINV